MKLISLILVLFIGTLPIATSILQIAGNTDIVITTFEEEQSEEETEEEQEEKLTHRPNSLLENESQIHSQIKIPRQESILYNFQSYRGIITPPPESV